MINLSHAMMAAFLQTYAWPFLRIGGLVMTAAPFNSTAVAPRARLILAFALTLVLAPLLPPASAPEGYTAGWWLAIGREFLTGAAMGLVLQLVFEAVMLAGELVSYGMGLGFAQLADPVHGAAAPMLGQFYQICAILLFFSLGGHLQIAQLLVESFRAAPPAAAAPEAASFKALADFGGLCFAGALRIALPAVVALLLVNLCFGVMNRSAPALNAMSLGFPLSLIVGLIVLRLTLPGLREALTTLLDQAWSFAAAWSAP